MTLPIGTRLGPYEIAGALGAGGMGEVYRARDTRLDRTVAIKVLPTALAADPDRRARFEREAKAVAALDHPHICGIFDVGEAGGTHYLVMPLVDGQTLADRLTRGPLPLEQALAVAREIADALATAHRHGIVHRDLKPANVMLTRTGAKLLDFGLAKLRAPGGPLSVQAGSGAATTGADTAAGTILGTVQYMAPEQVEGREVDARADIWAFGAVLYEMLTGTRAFTGDTAASVIGSILKDTPPPVSKDQSLSPPLLDRLVQVALAKHLDERWQSAADLSTQLRFLVDVSRDPVSDVRNSRRLLALTGWIVAMASAALSGFLLLKPARTAPAELVRFDLLPPTGANFTMLGDVSAAWPVISPDGSQVAFVARSAGAPSRLWVRRFDATEAVSIPGTDDAQFPFWSPDGTRIGYFADTKLKTTDLLGAAPMTLADVRSAQARGGSWSPDGTILFASAQVTGLSRVKADGSGLASQTRLDAEAGETSHRWPSFLPDGRHFVFTVRGLADRQGIYLASLDGDAPRRLVSVLSNAAVDPSGYLLFGREGTLVAQRFDLDTLTLTGTPAPTVQTVAYSPSYFNAAFSLSRNGHLAYGLGMVPGELQWRSRRGDLLASMGTPGEYMNPRPSPDGTRIAVARLDPQSSTYDVWLMDTTRNDAMTRVTFSQASERFPVWSPDGRHIAFGVQGERGLTDIFVEPVDSATEARQVVGPSLDRVSQFVTDWSSDGKYLLFQAQRADTNWDIEVMDLARGTTSTFLRTPFVEVQPQLSSNGRWLAYSSDESGRQEVYVRSFPDGESKYPVSTAGGQQPRWRADARELFYMAEDGTILGVPIAAGPRFQAGVPVPLFRAPVADLGPQFGRDYAVSGDGQGFLVNWRADDRARATVVLNWATTFGK
ncbi:MAG: protein kinase [Vicinamibacterales bacterium]